MYAATTPTLLHDAPERLPIIQSRADRVVGASERARMRATAAVKNDPTTTPDRSRTRTSIRRLAESATPKTRRMDVAAPENATRGSTQEVSATHPSARARSAPAAAPPEIPRM